MSASSTRFARSFFIFSLPRMATFPYLLRNMYEFGDINTSIYINPVPEAESQRQLNKTINELETERIVASDKTFVKTLGAIGESNGKICS